MSKWLIQPQIDNHEDLIRTFVVILVISGESMAPWSAALTVIDLRRSVLKLSLSSSPRPLRNRKPPSGEPKFGRPENLAGEECSAARKKPTQVLARRPVSGVKHDKAAMAICLGDGVGFGDGAPNPNSN